MSLKKLKQHEFIDTYLQYVYHTESPTIMHIWSSLASASACIGRHAYLPTGIGNIYPNIFTLLVGPPGTRKSQAMKYSSELVKKYTQVRYAPDDTGSQRQGLLMALAGDDILEDGSIPELDAAKSALDATDIDTLGNIKLNLNSTDAHCLFAAASEFSTFMGNGDSLMAALLNKVWDGESYDYRLKNERKTLSEALMTIIGCTTQSEIARILPAESIGQGFMSRWILCFSPKRGKRVPIDEARVDKDIEPAIGSIFSWLYHELRGDILFSKSANDMQRDIYMKDKATIEDTRFIYYLERRHTHLLKTAMLLAVLGKKQMIEVIDIEMANVLLEMTEAGMPDALGEFGLSPISAAKQKLLEFLMHVGEAVTTQVLWNVMGKDMKLIDFQNTLTELVNKKKIAKLTITAGTAYSYIDDLSDDWEDLILQDNKVRII